MVAAVGTVLSFALLLAGPESWRGAYAFSWLFAFFFFLTLTFGGCFWVLLHNVSNSGWGTSVRRVMENVGYVFPFMVIFGLPLLFPPVQRFLYEWMTAHRAATGDVAEYLHEHNHLLSDKYWYLNLPFWHARFFAYFLLLGWIIQRLRKWSVRQDTDPEPGTERLLRSRGASAWSIPVFALVVTFASLDWVMGLDYKWYSTIWGVYIFAGSALGGMAVIIMITILLRREGYLKHVAGPEHDHLMGKLAFAFTVFWAYIAFSQYFLIWYGNITEETSYYLLRNTEQWNTLSTMLVFAHFAVPFLLLIRADVKKNPKFMLGVSAYLLAVHLLDVYHMIIPERGPSVGNVLNGAPELWIGGAWSWLLDLLALIVVGAGFMSFLLRNTGSAALYPHRDPRILESANMHN